MNDLCYKYEKINNFNNSIFPSIDCCYVIIMENSKYEKQVRNQLKSYCLSRKILLQWNKGYKNCRKYLPEQISIYDLTDSLHTILHNAIVNNYQRIMILEEDFIINKKLNDKNIQNEINNFLLEVNPNILTLGSILWNCGESRGNFATVNIKTGTHALVLNKYAIEKLYYDIEKNSEIDIDDLTNSVVNKFAYRIPIIIQIFSASDNQNNWGKGIFKNDFLRKIFVYVFITLLKILGFTKEESIRDAYELNYKIHFNQEYKNWKNLFNYLSNFFYKTT